MSLWSAREIAEAAGGACSGSFEAAGLSIDSRSVKAGELFVALKGPAFDGHDFVADALKKGAAGALVARAVSDAPADKLVTVADTLKALEALGTAGRARSNARIIAVTGSVGKTGCKEALRQALSAQGRTYANEGSLNNHWGVPLSLARMPPDAVYGVFEMGMNHENELRGLAQQVKPHIALITAIAPVHIGNFKNLDEIAAAKVEIFEGLAPGGHAVINGEGKYAEYLATAAKEKGVQHIHRFGKGGGMDAELVNFTLGPDGSEVEAVIRGKKLAYYIGTPGEHWVKNSLAVLLCAELAGADVKRAADSFKNLRLAPGRGGAQEISFSGGRFTLIDESYNASPDAVAAAIRVLAMKQPKTGGRRLLALADMRELGAEAQTLHLALAPMIAEAKIDAVFCCGEMTKHLYDALPAASRGAHAFTSAELAPLVTGAMQDGDVITVKGSHSMMMEKVVAALTALHSPSSNKKASVA